MTGVVVGGLMLAFYVGLLVATREVRPRWPGLKSWGGLAVVGVGLLSGVLVVCAVGMAVHIVPVPRSWRRRAGERMVDGT